MRTALYIRVSTEEQAREGFSIAAQKDRLTAFVQSQDWVVFDYYVDEGKSAKDTNRPELQRMISDIKTRKIDVVLVYKLDRLSRSMRDLYNLLELFEEYDCKFKSASEVYDTTSAIGRLFINLVGALAQFEREQLAERVKFGMEQMAKEGKRPGAVIPYGYNKDYTINEEQAAEVREIFKLYTSGWGILKIAKKLNATSKRNWYTANMWYLLKNPAYAGDLRWDSGSEGETFVHDVLPPIVDRSLFEQAQRTMNTRAKVHPRQASSRFLFAGKVYCANCGSAMIGKTGGGDRRFKYYYCTRKIAGSCEMKSVKEEILEAKLLAYFSEAQDAQIAMQEAAASIEVKDPADEISKLEKELDKIRQRRKKWQYAWVENMMSDEEYRERIEEEREREQELQTRLRELQSVIPEIYGQEEVLQALLNVKANWDELSEAEKRTIIQPLDLRFIVSRTGKDVSIEIE